MFTALSGRRERTSGAVLPVSDQMHLAPRRHQFGPLEERAGALHVRELLRHRQLKGLGDDVGESCLQSQIPNSQSIIRRGKKIAEENS